jgi:REP element-mobilizing transposase RayT
MPRQARGEFPAGVFHVMARAVYEQPLFADDADRHGFIFILRSLEAEFDVRCMAYCLMTTHYHLLLTGSIEQLGAFMKRLNGRYAQRFNSRHHRHGHLFAERYTSRIVNDDQQLEAVYAYIDANPARAGLCDDGERWPWTWIAHEPVLASKGRDRLKSVPTSRCV